MIKGIIFDMDGVLVLGANKFHIEAWNRAFKENAVKLRMIGVDEYGKLEGMKGNEIQDLMLKYNNVSLPIKLKEQIYKRKKEIFEDIDAPYATKETKSLLKDLKTQGFKLAVASGNNRTVIDNFLDKQNLHEIFECTITGDEVEKGKPDPQVFLKALEKLSLSKHEVIIVENAPLGIQAAKSAGIFTIALTSTVPANLLKGADRIINNLNEIKEILSAI